MSVLFRIGDDYPETRIVRRARMFGDHFKGWLSITHTSRSRAMNLLFIQNPTTFQDFSTMVSHPYPNPFKVVQAIISSSELSVEQEANRRQSTMHPYVLLFALGKQSQVFTVSRRSATETSLESTVGGSYSCQAWVLR